MPRIDYPVVDADNHYYEPDDCCTRHLEPAFRDKAVHVVRDADGGGDWYVGDRPMGFARKVRDRVMEPGAYRHFMRGGKLDADNPPKMLPADSGAFREPEARLAAMDRFGQQAALLLPSLGLAFEGEMLDEPAAAVANTRAFNRYLEDEWGYAYKERIFTLPLISLLDRDAAVAELERVLAAGARMVMLRAGPVAGRSPADPWFDPFWARVAEARIPVALHIGISGYFKILGAAWGENPDATEAEMTPFLALTCFGRRPIEDSLAALILHNLFGRFPDVRVLSLENGSEWVPGLLHNMDKSARAAFTTLGDEKAAPIGGRLTGRPSEIFREHVYVAPFFEDSVPAIVEAIGSERVLFGSDWPHPEGVREPLDFLDELEGLPDDQVRQIMRGNAAGLLGLPD